MYRGSESAPFHLESFENKPITRVIVNNRLAVNKISLWTVLSWGLIVTHLKHGSTVIQGFDQSEQTPSGKIHIKTRFSKGENIDDFLVIDVGTDA